MKFYIIEVWKKFMQIIYFFLKFLKVDNKVLFMSRQTNSRNLDFDLITECISKKHPDIEIVILNRRLEKNIKSKILYFFHMFRQMYHMATSKIIIIDSYSILVSILNQRQETKVIQIWHALGSLKKFGYSILDKKEGRDAKIAKIMNMHKHYDYIVTSSEVSKKYFMEAFDAKSNQMIVLGLPRIDFLCSKSQKIVTKNKFYNIYEECDNGKENILYVPTYRKTRKIEINKLIKKVNYDKYNLIIKTHSGLEKIYVNSMKIEKGKYFLGTELLHVADYVITDYSAIVYEASIANKPIYFYDYDYNNYTEDRGFYIDYKREMPGFISRDINKILKNIEECEYNFEKNKKFINKYVSNNINVTEKLVDIIVNIMSSEEVFITSDGRLNYEKRV